MDNVEAIACDLNSEFQEAFDATYPHLQVVWEKRKDEQKRLLAEVNAKGSESLKKRKYILASL